MPRPIRWALWLLCAHLALAAGAFGAPVALTFLHGFADKNMEQSQAIVDTFNRRHPDVAVTLEPIPNNQAAEETLVRVAAGVAPDVISVHPSAFYGLVAGGILLDLTRWVAADRDLVADIPRPVLETVRVNGRIYALPQRISTYVLFYNKDAVAAAGLPEPARDWHDKAWNWNAFREAVRRLTQDTDGDGAADRYGLSLDTGVTRKFLPFILQAGGNVFDPEYRRFTLPEPPGLTAIEFVRGMFAEGLVGGSFLRGTAMLQVDIPPTIVPAAEVGFGWDVAALPQGPAGPATTLQPIPVGITAQSGHPEEAWTFLAYFMSREVAAVHSQGGIIVQPRRSVAVDAANYPPIGLADFRPFVQALEVGRPVPTQHPRAVELVETIDQALRPVWRSEQAAPAALAEITPRVEALLREEAQ